MKKFYASASLLLLSLCSFSQPYIPIDTSNGRYWNPNFFSNVTVTSGVTYGSAVALNNSTVTLKMDIYTPTGDTVSERPVLIFAHGGSFVGGTRTDQDVVDLCNRFAKMGYVCASIDYRLGIGFPIDSINASKAVMRATQDMKAAIRFFRYDFFQYNTYKIHPNYIFAGGSSAGAFMGLHLAYLDKVSEVPSWINLNQMGGLDGNSGNPGYSWHVNGVINLCGALGDSVWMEQNDVPFVSLHGTNDQTVPYGHAMLYIGSYPILVVDGSWSLNKRAMNSGTPNTFYTFNGADHVPYYGTSAANIAYMDTTTDVVKTFLRPLLVQPSSTGMNEQKETISISVYPNPASDIVYVDLSQNVSNNYTAQVLDIAGRTVQQFNISSNHSHFPVAGLPAGIYFLRMENKEGEVLNKKFVVK
jgi:acetyl esterase/lipase